MDHGSPLDAPHNHTSLVKVLIWMFSATATLCVIVRFWTKWSLTRTWTIDDSFISVAWIFSIAQGVLLTLASNMGYGRLLSVTDLDPESVYQQEKFVYASNILFFLSMCFSMLSTVRLIMSLSPKIMHQRVSMILTGITVIWTLVAVFGFAFQCSLPASWDFVHAHCFDQRIFYTFVASFNMAIEIGLVLQPAIVVWNLQLTLRKKIIVILCFCGRSTVIVALIAQIVTIWSSNRGQETILYWAFAICTVLVENLSIMAASIPYLKPFMESLESGFMGNGDIRRKAKIESGYGLRSGDSYVMSKNPPTLKRQTILETKWKFSEIDPSIEGHLASAQSTSSRTALQRSSQFPNLTSSEDEIDVIIVDNPKGITQTVEYTVESAPRAVQQ